MIEIVINLLISILANGIFHLAEKKDTEKIRQIEDAIAKLKEDHSISDAIIKSLKSIRIDSEEVNYLEKILSDDLFAQKISLMLLQQKDETAILIMDEVKQYCGLKHDEVLAIEPIIQSFALHFREQLLSNQNYAPFIIMRAIHDDGEKTRKLLIQQTEKHERSIEALAELMNQRLPDGKEGTESKVITNVENARSMEPSITYDLAVLPRTSMLLARQTEDLLDKLNRFFKNRTEEVRVIQKRRDYRKAIEMYRSLLSEAVPDIDESTLLDIYVDCALCCINLDEFKEADSWLTKAETSQPNDERVTAVRGLFYHGKGDNIEAEKYVERSLAKNPFYHIARMLQAAMDLQKGLNGKDIVTTVFLNEEGKLRPGFNAKHHAVIYRTIGQCFLNDKEFDEAIKYFKTSISLDAEDDCAVALLGHSYLEKAVSENTLITFDTQPIGDNRIAIENAMKYFTQALDLALSHGNLKFHTATYANLSMCHMLMGNYDTAFKIPNISAFTGVNAEILLKAKATAAFYSQRSDEAYELLSQTQDTSSRDVINKALTLLQTAPDTALLLLEDALHGRFTQAEIDQLRFLKYEILLSKGDQESAFDELNILDKSALADWEKQVGWGRYFASRKDHSKADDHFQQALRSDEMPVSVRVNIAHYYFTQNMHGKCLELLSGTTLERVNVKSEVFAEMLHVNIVSLFRTGQLQKCRELITYSKKIGVEEKYLYEISASIYWQNDELEMARVELEILLKMQGASKTVHTLCNAGMLCFLLGDLNAAEEYYAAAEKLNEFYTHSNLVINAINTYTIIGNTIKAKQILDKTVELQFNNKEDAIHKFALVYYLREDRTSQFARYAAAFNKKHGDVEWLWTKNFERDKEELQALFDQNLRRATELRKTYLDSTFSFPLVFMAALGARSLIIHAWRYNREYDLPIYLESGNAATLESEIKELKHSKSVIIDYTCLLALRNLSMKMRHFRKTFSVSLHHSSITVC